MPRSPFLSLRIAGCDLGKATASFVVGHLGADGRFVREHAQAAPHDGRPFEHFEAWYRDQHIADCAVLGATGLYADQLRDPVRRAPEDACQQAALEVDASLPPTLHLLSVGARGYSVLTRAASANSAPEYRFCDSDKCSSGAGENIQRMAARFGLQVDEADRLALAASVAVPITARCSVFCSCATRL